MRISLCGKSHRRSPSIVFISWPRMLLSPLTLTTVGAHHCVIVIVKSPKDCLVNAIQASYQSLLMRYSGAPKNCDILMAMAPEMKYEPSARAREACEYLPFLTPVPFGKLFLPWRVTPPPRSERGVPGMTYSGSGFAS